MASRTTRPNGHQWVFFSHGGKRHTVRLGLVSVDTGEDFRRNLERLIATKKLGLPVEPQSRAWLRSLSKRPYATLQKAGLVDAQAARTLGDLNEAYLESHNRAGSKPATIANAKVVCRNLVEYFGPSKPLCDVSPEDTERFREWMGKRGGVDDLPLARTTVSRRCRRSREIFGYAVDQGWLERNPFARMKRWNEVDTSRDHYVTQDDAERLIHAAPDHEWRLLIAMARYAGLRCPSEVHLLEWSWINWQDGTFRVRSPKTEHHAGQGWRTVPILERLAPLLSESWEAAVVGQVLVFPNCQSRGPALTGKLRRICNAAGVEPWPKAWINLRASCERDLLEQHPIDVAASWLGHSPATALRHYNRVAKDRRTREAGEALRVVKQAAKPEVKSEASYRLASDGYEPI